MTGQFIINPSPEFLRLFWVGFPYFSLPFGVTSAQVAINFLDIMTGMFELEGDNVSLPWDIYLYVSNI